MEDDNIETICDIALHLIDSADCLFSGFPNAKPCQIRLLDCNALVEKKAIRIVAGFEGIPNIPYATISSPWCGVGVNAPPEGDSFAVKGAEQADPIGSEVLRHACIAAFSRDLTYIWLDRLCIDQTSDADKNWHVQHMHSVYESSSLCIVLAGGMRRLVSLEEETPWVHRSWTLLEALAPREVVVLFRWTRGEGKTQRGYGTRRRHRSPIQEVVQEQSAIAPLYVILDACAYGYMHFVPSSCKAGTLIGVQVSMCGRTPTQRTADDLPFWRVQHKLFAPAAAALSVARHYVDFVLIENRKYNYPFAIWQSACMRSSSRPVDAIFSIMGLFGIALDPATFRPDDRRGATIALAQAILHEGGTASWLGSGFHIEPDRTMSSFPSFPRASVSGLALINTTAGLREATELTSHPRRYDGRVFPMPSPRGMDHNGYLTFTAHAMRLRLVEDVCAAGLTFDALDGSRWVKQNDSVSEPILQQTCSRAVYGALLGHFSYHHTTSPTMGLDDVWVMVLEEHSPGLYHLRSFYSLPIGESANAIVACPEYEFCVGGPDNPATPRDAALVQLKGPETSSPRIVYDAMVGSVDTGDRRFSISASAVPGHIRLVDCEAMAEQDVIRVLEFPEIPSVQYSAISYPWQGVAVDSTSIGHTFSVEGAERGDPVGATVLRHVCIASLIRGLRYLWVDRLCIMQTDRTDKLWQIRQMYRVYRSAALCIVLAGGIQRLVRLDEETTWIHRSWTLQEVLAPRESAVLLEWKLGWGTCTTFVPQQLIREVVVNQSALAPLSIILEACAIGFLKFTPYSLNTTFTYTGTLLIKATLFNSPPPTASTTATAQASASTGGGVRKLLAPNIAALCIAMDPTQMDGGPARRNHATWQCALMRTSSRPVDMVFSIMGLFGVTLDPAAFHVDDRRGATIALAQAILRTGASASWIGAAFGVEPDRCLSTFPTFPLTSVSGAAFVEVGGRAYEVSELVERAVYPIEEALVALPTGHMDDEGCLYFKARAIRLLPVKESELEGATTTEGGVIVHVALDGSLWSQDTVSSDPTGPVVYGALLGWFNEYFPGLGLWSMDNIRIMILEECRPGRFYLRSFFSMVRKAKSKVLAWPEREFAVGGRETSESESSQHSPSDAEEPQRLLRARLSREPSEIEETALRLASNARSQQGLEQIRSEALQLCKDEYPVWVGIPSTDDGVSPSRTSDNDTDDES